MVIAEVKWVSHYNGGVCVRKDLVFMIKFCTSLSEKDLNEYLVTPNLPKLTAQHNFHNGERIQEKTI